MSLQLSRHAAYRINARGFSDDDLAGALAGRCIEKQDGSELWYDAHSHCTVAVSVDGTATTCYRMRKSVMKRRYSR